MKAPFIALAVVIIGLVTWAVFFGLEREQRNQTVTVSGCLSGPNDEGAYILDTGSKKIEVRGGTDLKDHVGQQVRLTGQTGDDDDDNEAQEAKGHEGEGERMVRAGNIEMISPSCSK